MEIENKVKRGRGRPPFIHEEKKHIEIIISIAYDMDIIHYTKVADHDLNFNDIKDEWVLKDCFKINKMLNDIFNDYIHDYFLSKFRFMVWRFLGKEKFIEMQRKLMVFDTGYIKYHGDFLYDISPKFPKFPKYFDFSYLLKNMKMYKIDDRYKNASISAWGKSILNVRDVREFNSYVFSVFKDIEKDKNYYSDKNNN